MHLNRLHVAIFPRLGENVACLRQLKTGEAGRINILFALPGFSNDGTKLK